MNAILIDTNILVYAVDPRDAEKQEKALQVLEGLQSSGKGRISVQSLAEFISATTRFSTPLMTISEALQQVERLIGSFPIFDLKPMVVLEAARGARDNGLSYYDAQIWAVARLNQVPVVLSEDFSAGQALDGVRFINPFSENVSLNNLV